MGQISRVYYHFNVKISLVSLGCPGGSSEAGSSVGVGVMHRFHHSCSITQP